MNIITHQDLINSELHTLEVLRQRLHAAITILDADTTDIRIANDFNKIEACRKEFHETLRLIDEKGKDLQQILQGFSIHSNQ